MALQLTPEDYDYISLKAAEKALNRLYRNAGLLIALVTLIGVLTIVLFIKNYAKTQADVYLEKLIYSEPFKQTYIDALSIQVEQINKNHQVINQRLNESEMFRNLPFEIGNNAFEVTDSTGSRFVIEASLSSTQDREIFFDKVYSQPPAVFATIKYDRNPYPTGFIKPSPLVVYDVTEKSFKLAADTRRGHIDFFWVAIGY